MGAQRKVWTDFASVRHRQPPLIDPEVLAAAQPKRRKTGTLRAVLPLESDIQRLILTALRIHPLVARIERTNTGAGRFVGKDGGVGRFVRYGFVGQADLTGFLRDGRALAIEVKTPQRRRTATEQQMQYLAEVISAGGAAGVATSVDEALAIVEGKTR